MVLSWQSRFFFDLERGAGFASELSAVLLNSWSFGRTKVFGVFGAGLNSHCAMYSSAWSTVIRWLRFCHCSGSAIGRHVASAEKKLGRHDWESASQFHKGSFQHRHHLCTVRRFEASVQSRLRQHLPSIQGSSDPAPEAGAPGGGRSAVVI